jgi:hypothetical protein
MFVQKDINFNSGNKDRAIKKIYYKKIFLVLNAEKFLMRTQQKKVCIIAILV